MTNFEEQLAQQVDAAAERQVQRRHRTPPRVRLAPAVAYSSIAAAVLAASVIALSTGGSEPERSTAAANTPPVESGATPELTRLLGVLREPTDPSDAVPDVLKRQTLRANLAPGAQFDLAHLINLGPGKSWVIPAGDRVCLAHADTLSINCEADLAALQQGIGSIGERAGTATGVYGDRKIVSGLVPDGVTDLTVVTPDGARTPAEVVENVFNVVAPSDSKYLEYLNASGQRVSQPVSF